MTFARRFVIACIIVEAVALILLLAAGASARDLGQWDSADPVIRDWYQSLRQPDNPVMSCCGVADAYWADTMTVEGDKVFAIITDDRPDEPLGRPHIPVGTRFEIPPHKIKRDGGNPTGHFILFVSASGAVYCFVTGTLS